MKNSPNFVTSSELNNWKKWAKASASSPVTKSVMSSNLRESPPQVIYPVLKQSPGYSRCSSCRRWR